MTTLKHSIMGQIQNVIEASKAGTFADIRPALSLSDLGTLAERAPVHEGMTELLAQAEKEIKKNNRQFRKSQRGPGRGPTPYKSGIHIENLGDPITLHVDGLTIETANDKDVLQTIHTRLAKFRPARKPTKREKRAHALLQNDRLMDGFVSIVNGREMRALSAAA
jgi:hypothetical protein